MQAIGEILERSRIGGKSGPGAPPPGPMSADELAELQRLAALLAQKSAGALTPACGRCRDTGRVRVERPPTDPAFGQSEPCPECFPRREAERLARQWPVPPEFAEMARRRIEEPDTPAARATIRQAKAALLRVAQEWPGILIAIDGNYGTAKTHMLAKLYAYARRAGHATIYATAPAMERALTSFGGDEDVTPYQHSRDLAGVGVLLVDEADRYKHERNGADGNSHFERQYLDLINDRLMNRRPTILAGNRMRERLHPAIVSRASAGVWIDLLNVPDMRPHFGRKWEA